MKKILVVDDDYGVKNLFLEALQESFSLSFTGTVEETRNKLAEENFDLVFLDVKLPDGDGLKLLEEIGKDVTVCVITGFGTIGMAVKAMKLGAYDFLEKPLSIEKIRVVVDNIFNKIEKEETIMRLLEEIKKEFPFVGKSEAYHEMVEKIKMYSECSAPLLITGETGVGKDLVARLVHFTGIRKNYPFEYINCASIPKDLLESELFGFRKGAFTGATRDRKGKFELANRGTLLLNEVCDMPPELQAKILDALENKEVFPLGSERSVKIDVRIISITNKNIEQEVREGRFRKDLFYRLNVLRLHIPPLRERKEDIEPIALYYLRNFCEENNKPYYEFSPGALYYLSSYHFPGNVRELRNIIEKIVIMKKKGAVVTVDEVSEAMYSGTGSTSRVSFYDGEIIPWKDALRNFKRDYILRCLESTGGNITLAAKKLGIHRVHLHRLLKEIEEGK